MRIPLYSEMTPKRQQQVHMVMGGLAFAGLAVFVSSFIGGSGGSGGPTAPGSPKDMPKPRTLAQVPGAQLDSRDVWVGHAGNVPVHNPGFVLDDGILPIGASLLARLVETRLAA